LAQAVTELRSLIGQAGLVLPARVLVTTGPTIATVNGPAAGQCTSSAGRADRLPVITINPSLAEPVAVLSVLVHELVHAGDNCRSAHGDWFQAWARHLGLVWPPGSPGATSAGAQLHRQLGAIAGRLGHYP